MFLLLFILLCPMTSKVYAFRMSEHLDKYLASSKYWPSKNLVFSMGYDQIHDSRYIEQEKFNYNDLVDNEFARPNFSEPRIIFVSNAVEVNNLTRPSHPFSAAQRSLIAEGINVDRWDVKVNDRGHQFFGLYFGNDTYVTNRLRAHALLWVVNGIKDDLAILDDESLKEDRFYLEEELSGRIQSIIERLARKIKQDKFQLIGFDGFQDFIAPVLVGGSFVCVSHNYVVVSLMGESKVLLYDQAGVRVNMLETDDKSSIESSYFLSREYQIGSPIVRVIPRKITDGLEKRRIKYVILESSSIGRLISEEMTDELVRDAVSNFDGVSIVTKILAEDAIQKSAEIWLAQDLHFKSNNRDISLLIAELID